MEASAHSPIQEDARMSNNNSPRELEAAQPLVHFAPMTQGLYNPRTPNYPPAQEDESIPSMLVPNQVHARSAQTVQPSAYLALSPVVQQALPPAPLPPRDRLMRERARGVPESRSDKMSRDGVKQTQNIYPRLTEYVGPQHSQYRLGRLLQYGPT